MNDNRADVDAFDAYLNQLPTNQGDALERLRKAIKRVAPQAVECISYQLPAFRYDGKMLVGLGATSKHCALYLMSSSVVEVFADELKGYSTSKGTIRFQPSQPIPISLVRKLVNARIAENQAR